MNQEQICALIPHRPPFLYVDRVVELSKDRVLAVKNVDPEAEFFAGHYPGNAVMPGVLICECAFQAGALLLANRLGSSSAGTPVLTRIKSAKFKHIVRPGTTLNINVSLDEELGGAYFMTGRVTVDGKVVVRVEFACTLIELEEG